MNAGEFVKTLLAEADRIEQEARRRAAIIRKAAHMLEAPAPQVAAVNDAASPAVPMETGVAATDRIGRDIAIAHFSAGRVAVTIDDLKAALKTMRPSALKAVYTNMAFLIRKKRWRRVPGGYWPVREDGKDLTAPVIPQP